jgi:adenylate cyclase
LKIKKSYLYVGLAALIILLAVSGYYFLSGDDDVISSIAVLPLENLSGNPDNEFYADGTTEALIAELTKIKALRVISRTSAMRYKNSGLSIPDIALKLNVEAVVTGSVLRAGDRIRITLRLIEAETERLLWEKTYERDFQDILIMQEELARDVSGEIKVVVTPEERESLTAAGTVDPTAHELYLKGRFLINRWTSESLNRGIEYLEQALELDPENALAHAGLAMAYDILASFDWIAPADGWSRARAEALRALGIDETLMEAHLVLAEVKFMYDWDWKSADRGFMRAIELKPGSGEAHTLYAGFLLSNARIDESYNEIQLALEYDPHSFSVHRFALIFYLFTRRYDRAINQAREILDLYPENFEAHYFLGWIYKDTSMFDDAITEYRQALTLAGSNTTDSLRAIAGIARVYAVSGETERTRALIDGLAEKSRKGLITPYIVAKVYSALGESDRTFEWLERAYIDRSPYLAMVKIDPELDNVREDPRFKTLIRKMGLD